jgi:hypothetical protein
MRTGKRNSIDVTIFSDESKIGNRKSKNLFDHSIGPRQHGGWNAHADLLCRSQIDDPLESYRLLHRQVARLALLTILSIYVATRR